MVESNRLPDLVVCFDRDRTTSLNPSPARGERAVPLAWVKFLAHDPRAANVDVWATGNQRLCEEAAIPGTDTAVACWKHLVTGSPVAPGSEYEDDYDYDYLDRDPPQPLRRDRLRIVADLYRLSNPGSRDEPGATSERDAEAGDEKGDDPVFVVVDDVEMKDLYEEGIEHFLPWVFCTLVEDTDGQPEVFERAGVSLPLDELPRPTEGWEDDSESDPGGDIAQTLSYTNVPADSPDAERKFHVSHYDPTADS